MGVTNTAGGAGAADGKKNTIVGKEVAAVTSATPFLATYVALPMLYKVSSAASSWV